MKHTRPKRAEDAAASEPNTPPSHTPGRRTKAATELSDEQLEAVARDRRILRAMATGRSAREALASLDMLAGLSTSEQESLIRRALRLKARYDERGTVKDGRWSRNTECRTMTPVVQRLALGLWARYRGATFRAIHRKLAEAIEAHTRKQQTRGLSTEHVVPSYSRLTQFFRQLDPATKLVRSGGIAAWDKTARPLLDQVHAVRAGQTVYLDHTQVDIFVRTHLDGQRTVGRPWLTVALDCYSGAVVSFVLSLKHPDAWTTALLLRKAILPKTRPDWPVLGIPDRVVPDHGKDFMSHAVAGKLKALGVDLDPAREHYPDGKAAVERFFRSANEGLWCILPGYTKAEGTSHGSGRKRRSTLLALPQLREELERWIAETFNHRRLDRTGRTAIDLWQETAVVRMLESVEELDLLLLTGPTVRRVSNKGVRFTLKGGPKRTYWHDDLVHHWGREVRIAYNPDDLSSVVLLNASTGARICEAWPRDQIDREHFVRTRRQQRIGLVERMKAYAAEIDAEDRRVEEADAWDEARAEAARIAAASPTASKPSTAAPAEDPEILRLLRLARRPSERKPAAAKDNSHTRRTG